MDALSDRNLTTHTYDEELVDKLIKDIKAKYFPLIEHMYLKLKEER